MSILSKIKEEIRRRAANDSRYFKELGYVFELISPFGRTVFPAVLPPTAYTLTRNFAKETTPTIGAGLVVEEDGIIRGSITLDFDWGFGPKRSKFVGLPEPLYPLTGHGHFLRFASTVLDAYSDLKADPSTAGQTKLNFHVLRDDHHFEVAPTSYSRAREAGRSRVRDPFKVELEIVGPAVPILVLRRPPTLKQVMRAVNTAITEASRSIQGIITDASALLQDVRLQAGSIAAVSGAVRDTIAAVDGFLTGVTSTIEMPIKQVLSAIDDIEAIVEEMEPLDVRLQGLILRLGDSFDQLAAHPEKFEDSLSERLANTEAKSTLSQAQIDIAAGTSPPQSVGDYSNTAITPGDAATHRGPVYGGNPLLAYSGLIEVVVRKGDTLPGLAATYLGDQSYWMAIARANGLRSPYIADAAIPRTVQPGDRIVIPITGAAPEGVASSGSSPQGAEQLSQYLGADFKLATTPGDRLDLDLNDETKTSTRVVEGVPNLAQALQIKLRTYLGANRLFPRVGLPRTIGSRTTVSRLTDTEFNVRAAILEDSRVERLNSVEFRVEADAVITEIEAVAKTAVGVTTVSPIVT